MMRVSREPRVSLFFFFAVLVLFATFVSCSQAFHEPHFVTDRSAIVELYFWRLDDIGEECQRFLGPKGYAGVQVSPPLTEHVILPGQPTNEQYEVVSYSLKKSRAGTLEQLEQMVRKCNDAGVRVYVDIVLNNMAGEKSSAGRGSAGSFFNASDFSYPGVPFNASHFHTKKECGTKSGHVEDPEDVHQVRTCVALGLQDLDQSQMYVQEKQVQYLNQLIDMGVAGFRVDASVYMDPKDLGTIFRRLNPLKEEVFGEGENGEKKRPFVYHELLDPPFPFSEFYPIGRVIAFDFADALIDIVTGEKGAKLSDLKHIHSKNHLLPGKHVLTTSDNQDLQRRRQASGLPNLCFKNRTRHVIGTTILLSMPYGVPRVMSSFNFPEGRDIQKLREGPPHYENGTTAHVVIKGNECQGGWVCEHRWRPVRNMVRFHSVVGSAPLTHWWDDGNKTVAFARKGRGFVFISNEAGTHKQRLETGLPTGVYCDVIHGIKEGQKCTGPKIPVDENGRAEFAVPPNSEVPVIAIHIEARE